MPVPPPKYSKKKKKRSKPTTHKKNREETETKNIQQTYRRWKANEEVITNLIERKQLKSKHPRGEFQ